MFLTYRDDRIIVGGVCGGLGGCGGVWGDCGPPPEVYSLMIGIF